MTEPESYPPELTPAQEEAVRRRLAAARYTEPLPGAVAERLDRVLVGLAEERSPAVMIAPVTHLTAHRRRRAAQLLVAAAAVVVAGFGIGQLVGGQGGAGEESAGSSDSALQRSVDGVGKSDTTAPGPYGANAPSASDGAFDLSGMPVIRPDHFRFDVADTARKTDYATGRVAADCRAPVKGERSLAVAYRGTLATLIYHAPQDDLQRVDLYRCDPPGFVRSVVIPGP
jgi:hypothetical protein